MSLATEVADAGVGSELTGAVPVERPGVGAPTVSGGTSGGGKGASAFGVGADAAGAAGTGAGEGAAGSAVVAAGSTDGVAASTGLLSLTGSAGFTGAAGVAIAGVAGATGATGAEAAGAVKLGISAGFALSVFSTAALVFFTLAFTACL